MRGLTVKQMELYIWLKSRPKDTPAPSFEEMKEAMGLKSKSGVKNLLNGLKERGAVDYVPFKSRTVKVLK